MQSHRRLVVMLSLAAALLVAACGQGTTAGNPSTGGASGASGRCPANAGLPANVSDHGAIAASGHQLTIEANDFFFKATCFTGVPGGTLTLTVRNAGQALHNVSIPSLGVDMDVSPGQIITVSVKMGSTPLIFFCKYHKSVGMYGALLPAGRASACCCSCSGLDQCSPHTLARASG